MSRRAWILLSLPVLLVAGGVLYLSRRGATPDKVADLVSEGGEKVLREPIRPARGGPRVLVFALDGVGDGELRAALATGRMPHALSLLGRPGGEDGLWEHGWAEPHVLSILPSTTFAAWASLFTGLPAGQTGVPGNEWFAREEGRFHAPAPVTVTDYEEALGVYTDQAMSALLHAPTVYERANVRSYVSLQAYHRGADVLTVPDPASYGEIVAAAARGLGEDDDEERPDEGAYAALDENAAESLVATIGKRGVADLQVVYFPGVDLYTHVAENPLPDEVRYLGEVVDPAIGRILDAYRKAGALDSTWVLFVADHGHTPVLGDDRHSLGAHGDDEPTTVLERTGFRLRELDVGDEDDDDFQAAVAYEGAFAYVYLADRSTCPRDDDPCDWKRPPRRDEDVLPVVRAFDAANRTGAVVPELKGTLDLIFARGPRRPGAPPVAFQVWDGTRLVPIGAYLRAHPRPDLLDLERRLEGLATGPYGDHAGDVLLLARSGLHLPIEERFYFSGREHSWHGSPSSQDSEIPLLVARPASSGGEIRGRVRRVMGDRPDQLRITPLILDLLAPDSAR